MVDILVVEKTHQTDTKHLVVQDIAVVFAVVEVAILNLPFLQILIETEILSMVSFAYYFF